MTEEKPERIYGGELEQKAMLKAAEGVASLFDRMLLFVDEEHPSSRDAVRAAFSKGKITVRATLEYDLEGLMSFQYHAVDGEGTARVILETRKRQKDRHSSAQ